MRGGWRNVLTVVAGLSLIPATAFAQASITGVVRDASGAVLPGVTVEAASPVLIEKIRTVVTDGTGQYRIVDLRPGTYTVTFTLSGFSIIRREGIVLTGTFTATVNADLRVGGVEETITVTGEAPVVDVQSTTRQQILGREHIDSLPMGRTAVNMVVLLPGAVRSGGARDVGGVIPAGAASTVNAIELHGSTSTDQVVTQDGNNMMAAAREGFNNPRYTNPAAVQEITVDSGSIGAEYTSGGIRMNLVSREGSNVFSGLAYANFVNDDLQSSNFSDELRARGLRTPNSIKRNWELNGGLGGPLKRDRLWFYLAGRYTVESGFVAGMFHNVHANDPNAWTYVPDLSRPASARSTSPDGSLNLTWQATSRNKLGFQWQEQSVCHCPAGVSATTAPEAANDTKLPKQRIVQASWTLPVTNRLLLEAGGIRYKASSNREPLPGHNPLMISVLEQSNGLRYRSATTFRWQPPPSLNLRAALSYVTGAHALKLGITHRSGFVEFTEDAFQHVDYRFNNGVPNRITLRALPSKYRGDIDHDIALFAQDRWTLERLTLSGGVRYEYFTNSFPEIRLGAAQLVPTRNFTFPEQENLAYHDITPRLGASYDLSGTGRTAVKVSLNRYLQNLAGGFLGDTSIVSGAHAANALVTSTTRSWRDQNLDFVPNCDLTNPLANGECGAMENADFGRAVPSITYDPDLMRGFGKRGHNWEFSAGIQHELVPRVAVDASFFRRWYGNFVAVHDRNRPPSAFDEFSITAPAHPDLPGGGGFVIGGLFDLKPEFFGLPADDFVTRAKNFGEPIYNWNGVDVTITARDWAGLTMMGGVSTGRSTFDACDLVANMGSGAIPFPFRQLPEERNPTRLYCRQQQDLQTQVKFLGSYLIPRVDVQVSAVFQSLPGPQIAANYNASTAEVARSLGRPLSGGARNVTVNLVAPGTVYGERSNQVDFRAAKIVRFGGNRLTGNFDVFNAFNSSAVQGVNSNFAVWQRPTAILLARFVRLSAQFDF